MQHLNSLCNNIFKLKILQNKKVSIRNCSIELPNDEECDATDDDSSTTAGLMVIQRQPSFLPFNPIHILRRHPVFFHRNTIINRAN